MRITAILSALVVSVLILSGPLQAQTAKAQTAQAQTEKKADKKKCFALQGTTDYYFGVIDQTETVEHTFVFKNGCDETVEISQARASCGCTAAVISEKVIPPGGEAKIRVKFTPPRGTRGKTSKTVSLYLKDEAKAHTIIRFSAKIRTDIEIKPPYIQLMGAKVGEEISGTATVTNVSDKTLELSGVSFNMTAYADTAGTGAVIALPLSNVKAMPTKATLKPGETQEIKVTVVPQYKGQMNGSIRLKTGKNEGMIQVFGIVRVPTGDDEIRK